jgi:hypothetical protein
VIFPGYQVVAPKPTRPLPSLALTEVRLEGEEVIGRGMNITAATRLVLDNESLQTTYDAYPVRNPNTMNCVSIVPSDEIHSLLNHPLLPMGRVVEAYLSDGIRRSNMLTVRLPDRAIVRSEAGRRPVTP